MKKISRAMAIEKIKDHFTRDKLDSEKTRKIKRLAMKFNIKLGKYRARFCKKCYSELKNGKVRVSKNYKTITCPECNFINRVKI